MFILSIIAYEKAIREKKLRNELSIQKKQNEEYKRLVDKAKKRKVKRENLKPKEKVENTT